MHFSAAFPEIRKEDRLEMHPLNNIRYMFNNADELLCQEIVLPFSRESPVRVRGEVSQGELQNSSHGAGSASVLLKHTSVKDMPTDTGSIH